MMAIAQFAERMQDLLHVTSAEARPWVLRRFARLPNC